MTETGKEFSPFNAPVQGSKKVPEVENVSFEEISESEVTGEPPPIQEPPPQDAPEFNIPEYDDVPEMEGDFGGDFEEQVDDSSGDSSSASGEGTEVPEEFSKEFAEYTAKWFVDIYFKLFIAGIKEYAKIDRTEVMKAINQGIIHPSYLRFVDEANENVDSNVHVSEDEKEFITEPLKYLLEVKKFQMKPEYMVLTSLAIVSGSIFMNAQDLKKQNRELLDRMIQETDNLRRGGGQTGSDQDGDGNVGGGGDTPPPPMDFTDDAPTQEEQVEYVEVEEVRD